MLTDSENNMMSPTFSFHSFGGRRFLLLIVLFLNLQIIQAVCRHTHVLSSDIPPSTNKLVISEGTFVSGMEHIYIPHQKKERKKKIFKGKNRFISYKRKRKKGNNFSQSIKTDNKTASIFIGNTTSEKSLLLASHTHQQIIIPNQNTIPFLLFWAENRPFVLSHLLDGFLKKTYRDGWFSDLKFFRKFSRPPPFFNKVTVSFVR